MAISQSFDAAFGIRRQRAQTNRFENLPILLRRVGKGDFKCIDIGGGNASEPDDFVVNSFWDVINREVSADRFAARVVRKAFGQDVVVRARNRKRLRSENCNACENGAPNE